MRIVTPLWRAKKDIFASRERPTDHSPFSFGLSTSTDILRSAARARYEQSKLDVAGSRRNYRLLKDTVVREVKDVLRRLDTSRKRIAIRASDIDHAGQKLRLAQMRFDRGLADNFELIMDQYYGGPEDDLDIVPDSEEAPRMEFEVDMSEFVQKVARTWLLSKVQKE